MQHVEDADSLRSEEVVEEHLFCRVISRLGYRGSILTIIKNAKWGNHSHSEL